MGDSRALAATHFEPGYKAGSRLDSSQAATRTDLRPPSR